MRHRSYTFFLGFFLLAVAVGYWQPKIGRGQTPPKPAPAPRSPTAGPLAPGTGPAAPTGAKAGDASAPEAGDNYKPLSPNARVAFNLEDADLPDLVRLISSITGKRFILPTKSRSIKATVYAPTKVSAAEAYKAFLSILELNGMTIVPSGRYLKIVETAGIENHPLPTYTEGGVPGEDRYVTQLYRVNNVSAEDLVQLLAKFKSKEGNISAYAPTNTLILTDTGSNIRRMSRIMQALDVARTGEQVWIEPIRYANAGDLAKLIQETFPSKGNGESKPGASPGGNTFASSLPSTASAASEKDNGGSVGKGRADAWITKIIPDERSNSLVIIATERGYYRLLDLIKELDKPQEGEGKIHVHYLQHSEAEETANTLSSIVSSHSGGPQGGAAGGGAPSTGGGPVFEGQIKVTAHKPANALVITASTHDYATLRKVIQRLDAPRKQVFIEAVVMELGVGRSSKLGIAAYGGVPDVPSNGSLSILGFQTGKALSLASATTIATNQDLISGLAVGVRGPNIPQSGQLLGTSIPGFGIALSALATSGETNVLSTPHIIATDNQEAEITVGENVALQTSGLGGIGGLLGLGAGTTGAATGAAGAGALGAAAGAGGFGFPPRQDVGTSIKITPHLNQSDQIRLDISEEISEVKPGSESGTLGVRTITKRNAKTKLVVKDQQTVVIGGLMRDTVITEQTKVPILGDVPLIGMLFRENRKTTAKTNLLLFLTPYVIRSQADLRAVYERKMRERQEFIDRYFVFNEPEYHPPTDYSRTRGMVGEIVNEMANLDEEKRLYDESQRRKDADHAPKDSVGGRNKADASPDGENSVEGESQASGALGAQGTSADGAPSSSPTTTGVNQNPVQSPGPVDPAAADIVVPQNSNIQIKTRPQRKR